MAADTAAVTVLSALARAKINLTLHLCGQRVDGYHLLDSLVVFPGVGDVLRAETSRTLSLTLDGPFGQGLSASGDNLVLQAAERLAGVRPLGAALHLTKNLPIASGIGGGSSDAAAALDVLARLWGLQIPADLPLSLGADVPVCGCAPIAQRMHGIGERLRPVPQMPRFWIVLVNPLVSVATGAVFQGTVEKSPAPGPDLPVGFKDFAALRDWLALGRNDLQPAAQALCPAIPKVLHALHDAPLARMSGSGATCFALYPDQAAADRKAEALRRETSWWVTAAPVGDAETPAALHS